MQDFLPYLPSTIWPKSHDLDAPDDHDLLCMPQDLYLASWRWLDGEDVSREYLAKLISLYQTRFSGNKGGVPETSATNLAGNRSFLLGMTTHQPFPGAWNKGILRSFPSGVIADAMCDRTLVLREIVEPFAQIFILLGEFWRLNC